MPLFYHLTDSSQVKADHYTPAHFHLKSGIETAHRHLLERKRDSLRQLVEMLDAINPQVILKKGYCIPFKENTTSVMLSSASVKVGMGISLRFHDGMVKAHAREVKPNDE